MHQLPLLILCQHANVKSGQYTRLHFSACTLANHCCSILRLADVQPGCLLHYYYRTHRRGWLKSGHIHAHLRSCSSTRLQIRTSVPKERHHYPRVHWLSVQSQRFERHAHIKIDCITFSGAFTLLIRREIQQSNSVNGDCSPIERL